jgi:hypothetical protein
MRAANAIACTAGHRVRRNSRSSVRAIKSAVRARLDGRLQ